MVVAETVWVLQSFYGHSRSDIADALLAESANAAKESVASFDRDFRKLGVEFMEPG